MRRCVAVRGKCCKLGVVRKVGWRTEECALLRGEWDGRTGQDHLPPVEDRIEFTR
jgi:hypothetical protein